MEKIFKTFLKQELTAFLSEHSGWRPCKAPKGDYIVGKGPLWKRVGAQGRAVFLMCFIHEKRSEVELLLGWNAVDEFPSIDAFMENLVRHDLQGSVQERADAAVKLMLGSADGWLPAWELGLPQFFPSRYRPWRGSNRCSTTPRTPRKLMSV